MKLELRDLYRSMKRENIERYKFQFTYNKLKFEAIYFIDDNPHTISIGIVEHNFYFEISVRKGFYIIPQISNLSTFCKILGMKYDPNNKFHPSKFFLEFNNYIPKQAVRSNIPEPEEIISHRSNVEDSDRIYFKSWKDNKLRLHNVSEDNLKKTRRLLSYEAYEMCKRKNISSVWTDNPKHKEKFKMRKLESM